MATDRKPVDGGFIIEQEHLPGRCYVLTGQWTPHLYEVMRAEGVQYLRLNRTLGARFDDLSFLSELRTLRGVEIYDSTVKDVTPLLELKQLELLGLQCSYPKVDFAKHFPNLRLASFAWRPGSESFFGCRALEFLFIEGFPFADLTPLSLLASLRRLHINSRKLQCLDGIDRLSSIEHLTCAFCSSLTDIDALVDCTGLRILELHKCKKIGRLPLLSGLKRLRRVQIEDGGEIESLEPLRACEALEEVYLPGTKVRDGNFSLLLELKNLRRVAFPKSKAASHTMDQINAALAARN